MSFYWTKFQPTESQISKEEENLYRIRDYDNPNINKAHLVNQNFLYVHRDSLNKHDKLRNMNVFPKDPIWDKMTETERVENGLPSKAYYRINSYYHCIVLGIALGTALYRYQTMYYPFGVALRAQRYESWGRFLSLRAPMCLCALWGFYSMHIYGLRYIIDFSSADEEALDREFNKLAK